MPTDADEGVVKGESEHNKLQPSSSNPATEGHDDKWRLSSVDTDQETSRKKSSRVGKLENKKKEEEERRAREEQEVQRKAEEKRIARMKRKQERMLQQPAAEHRCHFHLKAQEPHLQCSSPSCGAC